MSKGPENTFIASVHHHLANGLYQMKNHNQYNGGIADVWYSGKRADLWVEYKFIIIPTRPDTAISLVAGKNPPLSHLQQDWLKRRHAEGRNVGVIVGSKEGGIWLPGTTWDTTLTASSFRAALKSRKELAQLISQITLTANGRKFLASRRENLNSGN